ncbi:MAG TPA: hypothetical protein PLQ36_01800, partial [Candidatus Gracilibacteria bacterium]|nr:hypothetical protein [Candidatus Gracilibacteria bacterium]
MNNKLYLARIKPSELNHHFLFTGRRLIAGLLLLIMALNQGFFAYPVQANDTERAVSRSDLVVFLVEEDLYQAGSVDDEDSVAGKIYRYAEDVRQKLKNTKTLLLPISSEISSQQIADTLETLYFDGERTESSENYLRGIIVIGEIPQAQVWERGQMVETWAPYLDFEKKAYYYNENLHQYQASGLAYRAEIWQGVIPEFGDETELKGYLDNLHAYYTGEKTWEDHIIYADLPAEQKSINADLWNLYQNTMKYAEDLAYQRYSNKFLKKVNSSLADSLMPDEWVEYQTNGQMMPNTGMRGYLRQKWEERPKDLECNSPSHPSCNWKNDWWGVLSNLNPPLWNQTQFNQKWDSYRNALVLMQQKLSLIEGLSDPRDLVEVIGDERDESGINQTALLRLNYLMQQFLLGVQDLDHSQVYQNLFTYRLTWSEQFQKALIHAKKVITEDYAIQQETEGEECPWGNCPSTESIISQKTLSDNLSFDGLPDIYTPSAILKFLPDYYQVVSSYISQVFQKVFHSGRFQDGEIDFIAKEITKIDREARVVLRESNEKIAEQIVDFVRGDENQFWAMKIPIWTQYRQGEVHHSGIPQYNWLDKYLFGQKVNTISDPLQCTWWRGTFNPYDLSQMVEMNRTYAVNESSDACNYTFGGCCKTNYAHPENCDYKRATSSVVKVSGAKLMTTAPTTRNYYSYQDCCENANCQFKTDSLENYHYKFIPSLIVHQDPTPTTIDAQVAEIEKNQEDQSTGGIPFNMPVDAVHYLDFQNRKSAYQKIIFPNLFAIKKNYRGEGPISVEEYLNREENYLKSLYQEEEAYLQSTNFAQTWNQKMGSLISLKNSYQQQPEHGPAYIPEPIQEAFEFQENYLNSQKNPLPEYPA